MLISDPAALVVMLEIIVAVCLVLIAIGLFMPTGD